MFDSSLYVKSEMDYRTEKIKRGTAVRRHRQPQAPGPPPDAAVRTSSEPAPN